MEELLYVAVTAAGAATFWWRYRRRRGEPRRRALLPHDEEVEIALHVAAHAARSRGQELSADHVLFALVHTKRFVAS